MTTRCQATEDDEGTRLDVFVARVASIPRAQAGALIDDGLVSVNDVVQRKAYRMSDGDAVVVAERALTRPEPPSGVEVVFADDDLLVISKPSGVVVHAAAGVTTGTLVDALDAAGHTLAPRAGEGRAGIVHRLDRDVSGLLIVAKTDVAHERLVGAMKKREIERRYMALVEGVPGADRGKIDAPIGRNPKHRTRMAVVPDGREAVTWFAITERFGKRCCLLEVRLETGRTHQIRVHLASIGHPVVGDTPYGRDPTFSRSIGARRPFLHAHKLAFAHPVSGEAMEFEIPLPPDLTAILDRLR